MAEQLTFTSDQYGERWTLPDAQTERPLRLNSGPPRASQAEYDAYMAKHPLIEPLFIELALADLAAGATRIGAKNLGERMRHDPRVRKAYGQRFKVNNNHLSRLARRAIELDPRLDGMFELRGLTS